MTYTLQDFRATTGRNYFEGISYSPSATALRREGQTLDSLLPAGLWSWVWKAFESGVLMPTTTYTGPQLWALQQSFPNPTPQLAELAKQDPASIEASVTTAGVAAAIERSIEVTAGGQAGAIAEQLAQAQATFDASQGATGFLPPPTPAQSVGAGALIAGGALLYYLLRRRQK